MSNWLNWRLRSERFWSRFWHSVRSSDTSVAASQWRSSSAVSFAFRKARVVGEREESGGSGRSRVEFSGRIIGVYLNAGRVIRFSKALDEKGEI